MIYNPDLQYRAAIIRGKSITEMDDLLPIYANIILNACPCTTDVFKEEFENGLRKVFPSESAKQINNHRTENAGKLFGMYWVGEDGYVNASERTLKLTEDNDQPAFFKDFCGKIQFPSPAQKSSTYLQQIRDGICIHPCQYILSLLILFDGKHEFLTVDEIAFYVLNAKQVLQGSIPVEEVAKKILLNRKESINKELKIERNHAFTWQHINELLKYMMFANLIEVSTSKRVKINVKEFRSINALIQSYKLGQVNFDLNQFDVNSVDGRKVLNFAWDKYYAEPSLHDPSQLNTSIAALVESTQLEAESGGGFKFDDISADSTVELGNQGEEFVFLYEKNRVANLIPRLQKHVVNRSKTKGIGYDIDSVEAVGEIPERKLFIEVKTTKRYSPVEISDKYFDTVNITRNEWVAASQHGDAYRIYRVYFSKTKVQIFEIKNPIQQHNIDPSILRITPLTYRIDFYGKSGKEIHAT